MAVGADHYKILGISRKAAPEEVTKAYRSLAKQYHPDKASHLDEATRRDRERQMAAINVAYSVMSSPRQRQQYDLSCPGSSPPSTARRASSWARGSSHEPGVFASGADRPPVPPYAAPSSRPPVSASGGTFSGAPPKPRYQMAGKYTHSSRQARRMDPSQYTVHHDGRASEFAGAAAAAPGFSDAGASRPSSGNGGVAFAGTPGVAPLGGEVRNPSYLQRQLDQAREWERLHCPANGPTEPKYEWKAASRDVLRAVRERRQNRDLFADDPGVAVAA